MAWVIVAGVLGVITICGGLFLRRLLGEITELRRQITRVDRQMRAQRARESFLRALISSDENGEEYGDDGDTPVQAAIVNGHGLGEEPDYGVGPPVRRKKHLGLYIGGAAAALTTLGDITLEVLRQHRGRFTAAVTGATVTAATATLVTIQPWTQQAGHEPPSSAPTVVPTVDLPPHYTRPPATMRAPFTPAEPSAGSTAASPGTGPASVLLPSPAVTVISVGDSSPAPGTTNLPVGFPSVPGSGSSIGPMPTDSGLTPGPSLTTPGQELPGDAPPSQTTAPRACAAAVVGPVVSADVCLLGG